MKKMFIGLVLAIGLTLGYTKDAAAEDYSQEIICLAAQEILVGTGDAERSERYTAAFVHAWDAEKVWGAVLMMSKDPIIWTWYAYSQCAKLA